MTGPHKHGDYLREGRHDRLLQELEHDPYHSKLKISEPTVCPDCRAVYSHGRWSWGEPPPDAHSHRCPACQREHDRVPAAFLTLRGPFFTAHKEEIMGLIHNYEEREKREHPLKRIMGIEEQETGTVITFTDAHLARGIGKAVHDAYEGEIDYQYTKEEIMLRVVWER